MHIGCSETRQGSRQPEVSEDTRVAEPGDRRDRVPRERHHDHSVGPGDRCCVRVREVTGERGLAVCAGRHYAQGSAAQLCAVAKEGGNRLVALVLERLGRHRDQRVVGQQRDDAVDVATLDGVGKAPDQLALAGGVRQRRAIAVGGRKRPPERRPGPLQGILDRGLARIEDVCDLGGAEAEHVAQRERGALAGRQVLKGADERQLDRLPGLVAGLRPGGAVRDVLQEDVRVRLEPDRLGPAGGLGRLNHGLYLPWTARSVAQRVQAAVRRDPVEPRAHRGSALEGLEPPPSRQQRLLNEVLGVLNGAEDPVAVDLQLPPVRIGELSKRARASAASPSTSPGTSSSHRLVPSRSSPISSAPPPGMDRPFRSRNRRCLNGQDRKSCTSTTQDLRSDVMTNHKVGTREEWQAARDELLAEEKELTRRNDELAKKRRELPWVPVEKEYSFETDEGNQDSGAALRRTLPAADLPLHVRPCL